MTASIQNYYSIFIHINAQSRETFSGNNIKALSAEIACLHLQEQKK